MSLKVIETFTYDKRKMEALFLIVEIRGILYANRFKK